VSGGIPNESGNTNTATPTPTPPPQPTATPTATPTVQPPTVPKAQINGVTVTPATASITLKPASSTATPLYPTQIQLAAQVALTNGLATDSVTWSTTATTTAAVSTAGLVTVGTVAGKVKIIATSVLDTLEGQKASASCEVTVNADGGATVTLK
jgi:hypothetical protein